MKKSKIMQEHISALMDAELTDDEIASMLAANDQDMRQTWETYHQIGDVLRSDDMGIAMSPDFSARMAARLDAEPVIVAPALTAQRKKSRSFPGRFAVPGMVAATIAAVAVFAGTSLSGGAPDSEQMVPMGATVVAESATVAPKEEMVQAALTVTAAAPQEDVREEVILRDPHIDEYLMAHQRFSPSVYSTAPYTRASAFAGKSEVGH